VPLLAVVAELAGFMAWCAITRGCVFLNRVRRDRRRSDRLVGESEDVMATPIADEVERWLRDRG
jgi:hypothetical protein